MMPRLKMSIAVLLGIVFVVAWWWRGVGDAEFWIVEPVAPYRPGLVNEDALAESTLAAVEIPQQLRVARGQTLFGLFESLGLAREQANSATFAVQQHMDPRELRAGTEFAVYRRRDESLSRVVFPVDRKGEIQVKSDLDGWRSEWREYRVVEQTRSVAGKLKRDLSTAMQDAGAPYSLATALADVLQWDLDFNRDLRTGDEFSVMYTGVWVEGRFQGVKAVEAAIYTNRGRNVEAYRYGEDGGYYDAEGRPLRKQFLKSPLPFTRITSSFSHSRLHPVLNVRRPHYGVDYGAPTGTPVRATANGTVSYRARSKSAGNMIKIRHPNGFETSYLHLSKFHKTACRGCRVKQGDLIGYVGSTGLVTAAHLDYRVKRDGRYMNPLRIPNTPAQPIPGAELQRFLEHRDVLRMQLPTALGLTSERETSAKTGELTAP